MRSVPLQRIHNQLVLYMRFKYGEHKTAHDKQGAKEEKGETVGVKNGGVVSYSSMLDGA